MDTPTSYVWRSPLKASFNHFNMSRSDVHMMFFNVCPLNGSQVLRVNVTWQKLCPQGVETGSSNRSRQMEQVNSCSENRSGPAASAIMLLLLREETRDQTSQRATTTTTTSLLLAVHFSQFCSFFPTDAQKMTLHTGGLRQYQYIRYRNIMFIEIVLIPKNTVDLIIFIQRFMAVVLLVFLNPWSLLHKNFCYDIGIAQKK